MSVPKWRRSESRLDAFYEAVKLRHIVTQIVMRSYKLKTNFKSLIPDRLRNEYPELAKLFEKFDSYKTLQDMDRLFNDLFILDFHIGLETGRT